MGWFAGSRDLVRVVAALPRIEWGRHTQGPAPLVESLRRRGLRLAQRSPADVERLRRLIAIVDRLLPGDPTCYRRALLEIALDAGSARLPLHLGLRVPGGPRSGHAWLGTPPEPVGPYDVQLDM